MLLRLHSHLHLHSLPHLMLIAFLFFSTVSYGKSHIKQLTLYQKEETVFVNVDSTIHFPKNVKEAILNGLKINFKYEFKINSKKWYKFTALAKITKNYHLSYRRITNKFSITNPVTFERFEFDNFRETQNFMESLRNFPLILASELPDDAEKISVRFYMSNNNLPTYIRVDRVFNKNWAADSDWYEWNIL